MNNIIKGILTATALFTTAACGNDDKKFDATGAFEADEIIVSAEQTGKILSFNIEEGEQLSAQQTVGQIDVTTLKIQKQQANASIGAISSKTNDASSQVNVLQSQIGTQRAQISTLQQQIKVLNKEIARTQNLVNADAVPSKQLDDLVGRKSILLKQLSAANNQIGVLNAQIRSAKSNVAIQNRGVLSEINPAKKQVDLIDEQINRATIINLHPGTVLTKYAMAGEFTALGKPLYKIADLSTITLRAYITGDQLPLVKLNQKVTVHTDNGEGGMNETEGTITWINSKAEFTPKTIQTKDERANMVYAIKVKVKNDGKYKIGMYGEINF